VDIDPYQRSFWNSSTHVLAPKLDEPTLRSALKTGHAYVAHDWMCEATGFRFEALTKDSAKPGAPTKHDEPAKPPAAIMGDEIPFAEGMRLAARFPIPAKIRLLKDGKVIHEETQSFMDKAIEGPGVLPRGRLADA
jgi:hypothetical protein